MEKTTFTLQYLCNKIYNGFVQSNLIGSYNSKIVEITYLKINYKISLKINYKIFKFRNLLNNYLFSMYNNNNLFLQNVRRILIRSASSNKRRILLSLYREK